MGTLRVPIPLSLEEDVYLPYHYEEGCGGAKRLHNDIIFVLSQR